MIYLKNKIVFPFWVFLRTFHIHVYGGEKHKVWKCEIQFRWLIFLCCNWAYFQYFISLRSGLKLRFPYQKVLIVEEFTYFQIYPTIHISQESCALILFFKNSKIATWTWSQISMLYMNVGNSRMHKIFEILMVHEFWHKCHSNICARNAVRGSIMQNLLRSIIMKVNKRNEPTSSSIMRFFN